MGMPGTDEEHEPEHAALPLSYGKMVFMRGYYQPLRQKAQGSV